MEELPAQAVLRRGTPRLGMGGTLVVAAIVALLAAGFGVLGGRPETTPGPTRAVIGPSGGRSDDAGPPGSPLVTPWIECAAPQTTVPDIFLQVNGVPIPGTMEAPDNGINRPPPPPIESLPEPIDVPVDVRSELWIDGGVCALAWTIDLVDDQTLVNVVNTALDPSHASQNRFELVLGLHPGGVYVLQAALVFPTFVARPAWAIRVLPVEPPTAVLHSKAGDVEPALGCDVTLTLATGWTNDLNPCADDVGEPPLDAALVRRGEQLVFDLEGWQMDFGGVVCGRLFGPSFRPGSERDCGTLSSWLDPSLTFEAPRKRGRWTLALAACGTRDGRAVPGLNRVCGTWYANIVVGE